MLVNFKATRYSLASLCQHRVSYFTTTTNLYNNLNNNNYSPLIYTAMLHWYNGGLSFPHRKVARLSSVLQTCLGWGRWCFFFRTGGYPWCCQNGHFGVPWTKWGEGRKKNLGGCSRRKCLKCRDFGVDSLESHGRHLLGCCLHLLHRPSPLMPHPEASGSWPGRCYLHLGRSSSNTGPEETEARWKGTELNRGC